MLKKKKYSQAERMDIREKRKLHLDLQEEQRMGYERRIVEAVNTREGPNVYIYVIIMIYVAGVS
jgi:hypothetical protein